MQDQISKDKGGRRTGYRKSNPRKNIIRVRITDQELEIISKVSADRECSVADLFRISTLQEAVNAIKQLHPAGV